jgi:hypothetical protein
LPPLALAIPELPVDPPVLVKPPVPIKPPVLVVAPPALVVPPVLDDEPPVLVAGAPPVLGPPPLPIVPTLPPLPEGSGSEEPEAQATASRDTAAKHGADKVRCFRSLESRKLVILASLGSGDFAMNG